MASSSHQPFSNRPYSGAGIPARSGARDVGAPQNFPGTGFGSAAGQTQQAREAQRLERERAERAEKERQQNQFNELSDEHREEINEAVRGFVHRK
jgi:centrin-3